MAQDNETRKRQEAASLDPLHFGVGLLFVGGGSLSSSTIIDTNFMHQWACYQFSIKDGQSLARHNQGDQKQSSNLEETVHFKDRREKEEEIAFFPNKIPDGVDYICDGQCVTNVRIREYPFSSNTACP